VRFTEIDLFGVYGAPISLMMVAARLIATLVRRATNPFDPLRYVWHRSLFLFAVYMIVLPSIVLWVAH
jgi:protein AaeX